MAQTLVQVKPSLEAIRIDGGEVSIDGSLSEEIWRSAEVATNFTQRSPLDGAKPSQKTEVRVLYSDSHIYIGAVAYDSAPDSITAPLFRRDGSEVSDWIYVNIDSYNDDRTAFTFAVNPVGVQKDILYFNDQQEDVLWDAVWDAATGITEEGWTAEFRIPLSQLRFTSSNNEQQWGINFQRRIARYEEINFWSPTPREEFGLVSWFGELNGIENIDQPLRLELQPYVSGKLIHEPQLADNAFADEVDYEYKAGGDVKYGITSDFTLTATINPDFGQVEADPATINLTAFETFFEERRPFFLEGSDIFAFGSTNSQNTYSTHTNFYSRRIGRSPSGDVYMFGLDDIVDYESRPNETTIAGAGKVSGKTENGLSVGILDAYTLEERSRFYHLEEIDLGYDDYVIEPPTNYFVGRIQQDIKDGDAQIGGFLSSVNRNMSGSYLENYLHKSAYQAGLDGEYNWANRNWGASGVFAVSQVNGTEEALLRTQTSSARYYNRPGSEELSVDSSATSLTGYFGEFSIGKYSGAGLRYSVTYSEMSPGYEVNDIGFQERADYRAPHYYLEYLNADPDFFRFYLLWGYGGHAWNFDGDLIFSYYASGAYFQFHNLWTVVATGGFTGAFYNDRITRGGALMRRPKSWNTSLDITSNTTKDFYVTLSATYRTDSSDEIYTTFNTDLNFRPTSFLQFSLSPTYIFERNTDQYAEIPRVYAEAFGFQRNIFSDIDLNYFYTELRLDWTFTNKISLQTYLRPLLVTGDYYRFKEFNSPRTYKFDVYGEDLGDISFDENCEIAGGGFGCYEVDLANNGETDFYFEDPDFNYKTVQGNAVLRWEYRPGSTLYFVWQQQRESYLTGNNIFEPILGTRDIFTEDPINIFLIKLSYWFGS